MEYTDYSSKVPVRFLYDGTPIPAIGIGTFGSDRYKPEQIAEAVYGAVKTGYRLIDCASVYGNEQNIGNTLKRLFDEGYVARKDLFITSKVWNDQHREVEKSCRKSLSDLGLDYLDLYFVHWPFPNYHAPGCSGDSRNADSKPFSVDEFMDTWRQCESLVDKGLVRHIAMSNMTIPKLKAVLPLCRVKPAADSADWLLPDRFSVEAGERPHGGGCRRHTAAFCAERCTGASGPSRCHLPEMGGTERSDSDPVFCEAAAVREQSDGFLRGSADGKGDGSD